MNTIVLSHRLYEPGMKALEGKAELIVTNEGDGQAILGQLKEADGFILRIGRIDRETIEACKKLKVITRPGVGVDNVDVEAATENGIPVVICPAANSKAVAEHTFVLMLALSKNLTESDRETRGGNFGIRNAYKAVDLNGKKVSILGFGNIGKELAKLCIGIGMEVLVYDPFLSVEGAEAAGCKYCTDIMDAVSQGDVVSLHMPSMPETRNLFGREKFAAMKPTAYFINCARGDLVDEEALIDTLRAGKIAGAGVDVLKEEPMKADHPLMGLGNCIVTPHMAAQTQETTERMVLMAAEGTLAVLRGERWENVCNPQVYCHPKWQHLWRDEVLISEKR